MFKRLINIKESLKKGKVLIVYGPRQVGKTTLIKEFLSKTNLKSKYVTGDDLQLSLELSKCTLSSTVDFVGDYELIVIDEAQKIENIGLALKLMVDNYPDKYFIATGSSSFDLASKTSEALTGRKRVVELYPISQEELGKDLSNSELKSNLEKYLIYGSYPEVVKQESSQEKEEAVKQMTNSYLLKDILEYAGIRNGKEILTILRLLAFQIGSEVSTTEIGQQVGMSRKTVIHYLDLLEKSFVIFSLNGFSKNLRKEVTKMPKYYFYDNGIRNAVISSFNKLESRDDIGQLWENFLMVERKKYNDYRKFSSNYYFWRTYDQKEIDLIEENSGMLYGYEFKWKKKGVKAPKDWTKTYKNSEFKEIHNQNYLDFIS